MEKVEDEVVLVLVLHRSVWSFAFHLQSPGSGNPYIRPAPPHPTKRNYYLQPSTGARGSVIR